MIIAIDFDGTCVTHEFPKVGKEIGAPPVLKALIEEGHKLILYTMRSNRPEKGDTGDPAIEDVTGMFLQDAVDWFTGHGIALSGIQTNPAQRRWTTSPKCYAELYIDDAALGAPVMFDKKVSDKPFFDWLRAAHILIIRGILPASCEDRLRANIYSDFKNAR